MATTTLLVALAPLAGAEEDAPLDASWTCVPSQDRAATSVTVNGGTYYQKIYQTSSYYVEELWQESNGESGLQYSSGMSCKSKADKLVRTACIGSCPLNF